MTIRDWDSYKRSSPDWAMLKGCFGPGIKPQDIDGHVERGGISLILEHKLPGAALKRAQDIAFDALRRQGNTVIVFWCESPDGSDITKMKIYYPGGPDRPPEAPATLEVFRAVCRWWYQSCPPPKYRYS